MAERESFDIVQYLPCAARPDGAEAREIAKEAVGAMLMALWPTGNDWPAQRETIVRLSGRYRPGQKTSSAGEARRQRAADDGGAASPAGGSASAFIGAAAGPRRR